MGGTCGESATCAPSRTLAFVIPDLLLARRREAKNYTTDSDRPGGSADLLGFTHVGIVGQTD